MLAWVVIYRRHGRQASPFPVLLPNFFPLNSFADPHPLNPVASILYENMGGGGAVSPFQLLISKPLTSQKCLKSFRCNTYGSPRKCCKQKTYRLAKPFRCNTYKKQGGTSFEPKGSLPPRLSCSSDVQTLRRANVSTCFPAIPFPFNHLRTLLHNGRHVSAFLSITCALFPSRRRVYPPSSHFVTHPLRIPRSPCSTIPLIFIQ